MKIYGGPSTAVPTCQVLPPAPGYGPYCPYTKNPSSGKWTAPDLAKAKQLIEESGTKGASVKVTTTTVPTDKAMAVLVGLLNSLPGTRPSSGSRETSSTYVQNTKNKVQFSYSSWY